MTLSYLTYELSNAIATLVVLSAALFAFFGIDDLLFDLGYWLYKIHRAIAKRNYKGLTLEQLRGKEQQRIAVYVPCWHEDEIVDKMVELACRSIQYSHYELFIGVYPNDPATVEKAQAAARRFPRVRVVVNEENGPTTKAQNLNQMYAEMVRLEGGDPYKIVVLHDVEDVIHPDSLLLYNFLIPRRDMVQLPVFPLERDWHQWTAWTYADEFAENHLKDLVIREAFGSFVPCAGVGCAFNRTALESLGTARGELFPTKSLTEDYQVGLRFREHGFSTIMVHQRLAHKDGERYDLTAASFVATREFFPDTFKTAVRQKARWITGICFQAWQHTGWTGDLFTRYTLYRDRKAIVANLLVLLGYAALLGSLGLSLWAKFDERVMQPNIGGRWWEWPILNLVFGLTILRLFQKAYFVASIYGPLQGVLALVRIPWGAIINAAATARACWLVAMAAFTGTAIVWNKTTHAFPTERALHEYRRQLGEVLIEAELVTNDDVALALAERHEGERIGETLVRLGYLTERQLVGAVARQIGAADGTEDDLVPTKEALALISLDDARHHRVLPLRVEDGTVMLAVDDEPSNELDAYLNERLPHPYRILITERQRLVHAIERSYTYGDERRKPLGVYLLDRGFITRHQLEETLVEQDRKHKPLFQLIVECELLTAAQIKHILEEYFELPFVEPPSDAHVPAEAVVRIPTRVLQENVLVLYESGGNLYVASPFPLGNPARDAIGEVLGTDAKYVAASIESLAPLRRKVLREVEHRRQLGQVLIDDKLVTDEDIALAMESRLEGERLGETLVRLGYLSKVDLEGALKRQASAETGDLVATAEALALVSAQDAQRLRVLPLRIEDGHVVVAADATPINGSDTFLREHLPHPYRVLLVEPRELTYALNRSYTYSDERRKPLGVYLLENGYLTRNQLDEILQQQDRKHKPLFQMIVESRVVTREAARHILEDYFKTSYVEPPRDAAIPLEALRSIPTEILQENFLALYESAGAVVVAAPFPIWGPMRDAIANAAGSDVMLVVAPADALTPLRRKMLHEIDVHQIHTPADPAPAP
jgi:bacteriophage N4 adsorption protein B